MTCVHCSGWTRPTHSPKRSAERVRTWLILTQERFGSSAQSSSSVSGKPAACGWLVMASAMTVPERSLKTS